jgi:hypothetical protein
MLLPNSEETGFFEFMYNKRDFSLLLTVTSTGERGLLFNKRGTLDELELTLSKSFQMDSFVKQKNYWFKIRDFFEIHEGVGESYLTPIELFKTIDKKLALKKFDRTNRITSSSLYHLPNPNAVYFKTLIFWKLVNSEYPGKKPRHYTVDNRDKVAKLLPDLAKSLKDQDVTVVFQEESISQVDEQIKYSEALNG